ncbi:hypothetical protein BDU57DRAFT_453951 [Ampelomyces quisqualis]|uniref:Uncharacterized protein n=1 Tax=Ampelomyces quisqualis TaxID=50730 RepID=A0A6A5QGE5_AMPQU|nr:hypothetical protein BDU57DRAFT_453951 [Ampelomyces quisqualis]
MDQTLQADHYPIKTESVTAVAEVWAASWTSLAPNSLSFGVATLLTVAALIVPILLWAVMKFKKMQAKSKTPFPFLELPQELRDIVYEHILEEPSYPQPPKCPKHASAMNWMLPGRWSSTSSASPQPKPSNWLLLANKQIYKEYMDLLTKRKTFHLTISPTNYQNPTSSPHALWKIAPSTLKQIRSAHLQLITTPAMLGVPDPRNMASAEWDLARQIRMQLLSLSSASTLTLDAKAIGDPLWNPLWIWFHACQSFKHMGTSASDLGAVGPRLERITFSLDTWSPGENFLARDPSRGAGPGSELTVREFCARLYQQCGICTPDDEHRG